MLWLNRIVDELLVRHPEGDVIVSSGVSPSGKYHLGTLREVLTAEAIAREVKRRGRVSHHIHIVDDLDIFRKVPVGVPEDFNKYIGMPLCDVPAPDDSEQSYADFYLADLVSAAKGLKLEMEIVRAHEKYRSGFIAPAIEKTLQNIDTIKEILEEVSGRQLDEQWSPVQILEGSYLKTRRFVSIDTTKKDLVYIDKEGTQQHVSYNDGNVKLSWRIDWPARWWLLGVHAEPFGRDHATKGGSYDTGALIARKVFDIEAPFPIPYNFINRTGDTKKMSKSAGETITANDLLKMLPAEIIWYFILRFSPDKLLFFDDGPTLMRLVDEFSELLAKSEKTDQEIQLLELCMQGLHERTVSNIPFSHLVASYQASLKNVTNTLEVLKRTEYREIVQKDADVITKELAFIDAWLEKGAPEEIKFSVLKSVDKNDFNAEQQRYLQLLADKIKEAPEDADGNWFHDTVYALKDTVDLAPKELFTTLYQVLIGKESGPRAGWFLSLLPKQWLIERFEFRD